MDVKATSFAYTLEVQDYRLTKWCLPARLRGHTQNEGVEMKRFEYDIQEFRLTEKWNPKKQQEKLRELVADLNRKGSEGWELIGLNSFDVVGGVLGGDKGKISLTTWKREIG